MTLFESAGICIVAASDRLKPILESWGITAIRFSVLVFGGWPSSSLHFPLLISMTEPFAGQSLKLKTIERHALDFWEADPRARVRTRLIAAVSNQSGFFALLVFHR